jgi:diadenosine tetraphosphate (Ap4A) HIT family hydrolase
LQNDTFVIGKFALCHLLLMNDCNYPWFVLVPDRINITEIHQLSVADQNELMAESSRLASSIEKLFDADKINIAALGNLVPQLHVHHIVRYKTDAAWPAPVWGKLAAKPYTRDQQKKIADKVSQAINTDEAYLR